MQISNKTIFYLKDIVTGDSGKSEYLSGSRLVSFFNSFGFDDVYKQPFPSRWFYTEEKLKELNNEGRIKEVIEFYYNPINFIENRNDLDKLIEDLNKYLHFDDLFVEILDKKCVFSSKNIKLNVDGVQEINHEYIKENIEKCDKKIIEEDYSGAVTNARSLVETILLHVRYELFKEDKKFNGNLNSLYKEISEKLNLSVNKNKKINDSLKKTISGLFSIISGISELGSDLGDRHGKVSNKNMIEKHHAVLVVNSAKTFTEFIWSSYNKQVNN